MNMQNHSQAKFRVGANEIEISGPPDFVKEQIQAFKPTITSFLDQISLSAKATAPVPVEQPKFLAESAQPLVTQQRLGQKMEDVEFIELPANSQVDYDNVLIIEVNQVQVIADVPGDSLAKRMINLILLYMWGKLQLGTEEISFTELREMCEKYGEVDKANFSKHMNSHKRFFLISGPVKNQIVRLIRPGIKEALRLITELNKHN